MSMQIPTKALKGSGQAFLIKENLLQGAKFSSSDYSNYLYLVGMMLSSSSVLEFDTTIELPEGQRPSVLIINPNKLDTNNSLRQSRYVRAIVGEQHVPADAPYGRDDTKSYLPTVFSEVQWLASVQYYEPLNINVYSCRAYDNQDNIAKIVKTAKKYFDVIIIHQNVGSLPDTIAKVRTVHIAANAVELAAIRDSLISSCTFYYMNDAQDSSRVMTALAGEMALNLAGGGYYTLIDAPRKNGFDIKSKWRLRRRAKMFHNRINSVSTVVGALGTAGSGGYLTAAALTTEIALNVPVAGIAGALGVAGFMHLFGADKAVKKTEQDKAQALSSLTSSVISRPINFYSPESKTAEIEMTVADPSNRLLSDAVIAERMDNLRNRWMDYELSLDLVLRYPLMMDASCPQTNAFYLAWNELLIAERLHAEGTLSTAEFSQALHFAEQSFETAEANARKMRHAHLDSSQKKKIKDAVPMLALFEDESASPQEKVNAWRKASDFLEGVVALPDGPILGLLEAVR